MLSFKKYNCTGNYETFVYYREYNSFYIQYMYAGYKGQEPEVLSETFLTNLAEADNDYSQEIKIIYNNTIQDCERDSDTPIYILQKVKFNIKSFIQ
jgi:hypothetical protein